MKHDLRLVIGQPQPSGLLRSPDQRKAQLIAIEREAGFEVGHVEADAVNFLYEWGGHVLSWFLSYVGFCRDYLRVHSVAVGSIGWMQC